MHDVEIYTDGSCSSNPGPGGYCAILICMGKEKVLSGGDAETTNNRMELMGVIAALEALNQPCNVTLTSDSKYVIDGLSKGWAASWKKRGWVKSDKKPALNPDLWDRLLTASAKHNIKYVWIKGHNGHEYNERCDRIAVEETLKAKQLKA